MDGAKHDATEDIRQYLEEDTFCRYFRDLDQRYLVGIGTDGLRWTRWMKDPERAEQSPIVRKAIFHRCSNEPLFAIKTIEGDLPESDRRGTERNALADEFVPAFAAVNLQDHVGSQFIN